MHSSTRPIVGLLCAGALLLTACGEARTGEAVPDQAEAGEYVKAKYDKVIRSLEDAVTKIGDVKTREERFLRLDDRDIDSPIDAATADGGKKRIVRARANDWPEAGFDTYWPDEKSDYVYIVGAYAKLAKTSWVKFPDRNPDAATYCEWPGVQDVCKMTTAISRAVDDGSGKVRSAAQSRNGDVEIALTITYENFLANRIIVIPDDATETIKAEFGKKPVDVRVVVDQRGKLKSISMIGAEKNSDHQVEINHTFRILRKSEDRDFPDLPKKSEVTTIDKGDVDKFYERKAKIDSGQG